MAAVEGAVEDVCAGGRRRRLLLARSRVRPRVDHPPRFGCEVQKPKTKKQNSVKSSVKLAPHEINPIVVESAQGKNIGQRLPQRN